ncbi:MAG: restriction endonuclease subunit S [Gammaproteobacteria bacterium]|nr:MAG: restriction endonuclease subunit S [Gammaproteobacteria bacterium]
MRGWSVAKLESLCDIFTDGDWIESKNQSTEGVRLIQTGNVGEGKFKNRREKARFISEETFLELKCREIFDGDCLVSRLPDPVGRSCILPETGDRMITAVDCSILRFKKDQLTPGFFNYFSQSSAYLNRIESLTSGATRKRISRKNLGLVEIPYPSIPEQKHIVAILDQAFADIELARAKTEQNLLNARELFESYLQQVFSQRGEGWEDSTLNAIAENLDSKRVPITKKDRAEGEFPYYGASGIVDYVDDYLFDEELLLVSEDGANLLARTYPIAFSATGKYWVNNHAHVLRFENRYVQKFIEYYLNSISLAPYVSGMAQPKLNQRSLNSISVPKVNNLIAKKVVIQLEAIEHEITLVESIYKSKIDSLDELKKSILQKAFSGELTKTLDKETNKGAAA